MTNLRIINNYLMAQRHASNSSPQPTSLTISKVDFKNTLSERIKRGADLYNKRVDMISYEHLNSEFKIWDNYNLEFLKQSFNKPGNEYRQSYDNSGNNFMGRMGDVSGDYFLSLKNYIKYKIDNLRGLLETADLLKSDISIHDIQKPNKTLSVNEVFIVHGHDNEAKVQVALFIQRLGFKPIILHEQANSGKTIIEKIEEYSNVGFGIVLYTQCDLGAAKSEKNTLKYRARQNVVFEHGYLIGKIGRSNVCALVKGDVETPNDISGVVYVKMDQEEAWHLKIAKELRSAGYEIDMNKL